MSFLGEDGLLFLFQFSVYLVNLAKQFVYQIWRKINPVGFEHFHQLSALLLFEFFFVHFAEL